ncbi:hypothetical protein ILYODFUR_028408, partial [Ilyodon furcidens]
GWGGSEGLVPVWYGGEMLRAFMGGKCYRVAGKWKSRQRTQPFLLRAGREMKSNHVESTTAPWGDECSQLTRELTAEQLDEVLGCWILIEGTVKNDFFGPVLDFIESMWMVLNRTADSHTLLRSGKPSGSQAAAYTNERTMPPNRYECYPRQRKRLGVVHPNCRILSQVPAHLL